METTLTHEAIGPNPEGRLMWTEDEKKNCDEKCKGIIYKV